MQRRSASSAPGVASTCFVDLEVFFLEQPRVGGHHFVGAHLDHIAGPQLRGQHIGVNRRPVRLERHLPGRWNLLSQ
jgi:hypothetical protein